MDASKRGQLSTGITILLALLVASWCVDTTEAANSTAGLAATTNKRQVHIRGWTQVNERWPTSGPDYFIAIDKGHHFIQVKLPSRLKSDLTVKLTYYYDYARVRPFFQIVPCSSNVDILADDGHIASLPGPRQWHQHTMEVRRSDCDRRKELAYNVLLHDANDVFAWSELEISGAGSELTTTVAPTTEFMIQESTTTERQGEAQTTDTSSTEAATTVATTVATLADSSYEFFEHPDQEVREARQEDNKARQLPEERDTTINEPSTSDRERQFGSQENGRDQSLEDREREKPQVMRRNKKQNKVGNTSENARQVSRVDSSNLSRRTRATPEVLRILCRPNLCDRSLVLIHPRFMKILESGALRTRPEEDSAGSPGRSLMYLNTDNQPITFQLESEVRDLADVDPCLDFHLYLDPDTSLALMLDEERAPNSNESKQKFLESFERARDAGGSSWRRIERCISDYMPKLNGSVEVEQKSGQKVPSQRAPIHRLKFSMVPQSSAPEGQKILINLHKDKMISLKERKRMLNFLPDAVNLANDQWIDRIWILDHDGSSKAKFKFIQPADPAGNSKKVLQIDGIDSRQKYLDLTSRWIKIDDPESLDYPALFNYKSSKAAWIKALDFDFQNANNPSGQWRSNRIYTRETDAGPVRYEQRTNGSTLETSGTKLVEDGIASVIRLKGLNNEEFRIRLRHHLDESVASRSRLHQLNVTKLSFGDICALDKPYCLNGGRCTAVGVSKAKCTCLRGYSGKNCEISRPCDVLYLNGIIGSDLCRSVGARCVDNIPVFRCIWPDDKYYQCRALSVVGGPDAGESDQAGNQEPQSDSDRLRELEATSSKQKQLIIVMGVFMAALMLFAIVIVINMVVKLQKSNKRLRSAKIEVHELTRQNTPGTSSSAPIQSLGPTFGRPGARNKPAAVLTYNNRAFDAADQ